MTSVSRSFDIFAAHFGKFCWCVNCPRAKMRILRSVNSVVSNCLSGNILLMCGHFLPRGPYAPACRKGLGQEVSSADEIGIAVVIAGDTGKHLCLAVAPIVLTTSRTCSGGASRIDSNWQDTVLPCQTFDPLPHPPIGPRGGGDAKGLASTLRFASYQSLQVFKADGRKPRAVQRSLHELN